VLAAIKVVAGALPVLASGGYEDFSKCCFGLSSITPGVSGASRFLSLVVGVLFISPERKNKRA
jgi:hypothetical protein